jgi:anti-anti-sigma factor
MHGDEFSIELHQDGPQLTIKGNGRLDLRTVGRLRCALVDACVDPRQNVTLDLTDVQFSNALTVAALARTARQVCRNECHFIVRGLNRFQAQLLRISAEPEEDV